MGWCWRWNSNTLVIWWEELTHWKRPWCWEILKAGEEDDRGWDGWMASLTQWTFIWINSGSWRWTEKPGVLQSMFAISWTWLSDRTELIPAFFWPPPTSQSASSSLLSLPIDPHTHRIPNSQSMFVFIYPLSLNATQIITCYKWYMTSAKLLSPWRAGNMYFNLPLQSFSSCFTWKAFTHETSQFKFSFIFCFAGSSLLHTGSL